MAKHRGRQHGKADDEADDTDLHDQTPSNTTSGGEEVTPTDGPADLKANEGVAVYPPSPSDSSGEKTDNVPPSKRLPPDPPPEENPAAGQDVTTASAAIAQADQSIAGLQARVSELEAELTKNNIPVPGKAVARKAGGKRFRVTMPVESGLPEGEFDADDERQAKAAYKQKHGLWATPFEPHATEVKGE